MNRRFLGIILFPIAIIFSGSGAFDGTPIGNFSVSNAATVTLYQNLAKTEVWKIKEPLAINLVKLSPNGNLLAVSYKVDPRIDIFDASTGKLQYTIEKKPVYLQDVGLSVLLWSPSGDYLASVIPYEPVDVWNMSQFPPKNPVKIEADGDTSSLTWSPDSKSIAGIVRGRLDKAKTIVWDIPNNNILATLDTSYSTIYWSPDGTELAIATGKNIQFWNASNFKLLRTLNPHSNDKFDPLGLYAWSPDSKRLAGVSCDTGIGNCLMWVRNLEDDGFLEKFEADETTIGIKSILWSEDGKLLISDDGHTSVRIWGSETGKLLLSIEITDKVINAIDWNSTSSMLVIGSSEGEISLWKVKEDE